MALDAEQQQVRSEILRRARRRGLPVYGKIVKSAFETGLVESNLRNLPGGDADSQGWRQERASLYPNPRNLGASIERYFDEAEAIAGRYGSAGDLAAAVQRPAAQFRGRYQDRSAEADALLRGSSSGARAAAAPRTSAAEQSAGQQLTAMLIEPPEPQVPRPSMGLAAPEFAAGPKLAGGQSLASGAPAESPGQRLTRALTEAAQLPGMETPATPKEAAEPVRTGSSETPAPVAAGGKGVAKITGPNPGRINPLVTRFMRQISAVRGGRPVVGSDGTGHSKFTVNGNVSEHYTGNASDIPAAGSQLVLLGQAALIAAGMPRAQARKQRGGLFNVVRNGVRYQIIFATNEGGNHFDHLHVGAHRV